MANIKFFENLVGGTSRVGYLGGGINILKINAVYIPGTMSSFSRVFVGISGSNTTAKTASVSFGLYSLTGSTLTLLNSASRSTNQGNRASWLTLITSASSNITPGNYYLAIISSTAGNSGLFLFGTNLNFAFTNGAPSGAFFRGELSVTTNGIPISIHTSDMLQEGTLGGAGKLNFPYIVLVS